MEPDVSRTTNTLGLTLRASTSSGSWPLTFAGTPAADVRSPERLSTSAASAANEASRRANARPCRVMALPSVMAVPLLHFREGAQRGTRTAEHAGERPALPGGHVHAGVEVLAHRRAPLLPLEPAEAAGVRRGVEGQRVVGLQDPDRLSRAQQRAHLADDGVVGIEGVGGDALRHDDEPVVAGLV